MLLPVTHDNKLQKRRGIAKVSLRNAIDASLQAMINLSPSSELGFTIATESSSYISAESGYSEKLDTTIDSIDRTFTLACERMERSVMAMFIVGTLKKIAQAGGSVSGEISPHVFADRSIQLGGLANNGTGVFGATAQTISSYEGLNAAAWATGVTHAVGAVIAPTTPNAHWYMAVAITTGTTDALEPTFPTNGSTVVDGGVTWQDMGVIEYVADTDYSFDGDYAHVNIPSTGAIAAAVALVPTALTDTGRSFRLSSDYTLASKTIEQLATGDAASLDGEFWFYTQNPKGEDEVWRAPAATLTPNGDFSLKSGSDYGSMGFTVTAQKPPAAEALYINGKPA